MRYSRWQVAVAEVNYFGSRPPHHRSTFADANSYSFSPAMSSLLSIDAGRLTFRIYYAPAVVVPFIFSGGTGMLDYRTSATRHTRWTHFSGFAAFMALSFMSPSYYFISLLIGRQKR